MNVNQQLLGGVIIVLLTCAAFAQKQSTIMGTIADSEGAAIANARVIIHWDSAGSTVGLTDNIGIQTDLIVTTDKAGRYSIAVPPGFYDVFVSAMAFTPAAAKVRVKKGQQATNNAKLRADPLVMRELAH